MSKQICLCRRVSTDVYAKADIEDVDSGPPEHLWSNIAEESRAQSMAEGVEQLTEVSQQDLRDNEAIPTSAASALHVRCQEIPYRQYLRDLWSCSIITGARKLERRQACHVFLSGPGGVGKSHVIIRYL